MRLDSRALSALVVIVGATAVLACAADTTPETPSSKPAAPPDTAPHTDAGTADAATDSASQFAPPPPPCTAVTYSDWSICHFSSTQTRTVVSASPADCFPSGLVLKQPCTFTEPTDGPGLYAAYCSDCHGNNKKGASASAIQNAINGNRGGMSVISSLTPAQIALIAAAP
jgi:hypothetical protein